jgi:hypothetical protein
LEDPWSEPKPNKGDSNETGQASKRAPAQVWSETYIVVVEEKSFVDMILIRGEPLKSNATKMTKARRCQMIASSKDC